MIFNVLETNQEYHRLIELVDIEHPDIILLIETNKDWAFALDVLLTEYPYTVKEIREDTYGIYLLSRIQLEEARINHLVKENIPSVEVVLDINKSKIRIIGIHPEPPLPGEALTSKPKDLEMLKVASKIQSSYEDELNILIGDLNDVGWSRTSEKFKSTTQMGDPREGRGFYATFPTYSPIKIPIDHVFCSKKLGLISFRTLDDIGSDHLPVCVSFSIPDTHTDSKRV